MIKQQMDNSRRHLGELAVMQSRVNETEKRILESALTRLDAVNASLDKLRPAAAKNSKEYQDLILERGHLHHVIAHARTVIDN